MCVTQSSVILNEIGESGKGSTRFRLLRSFDSFEGADVFSLFLTTETDGVCTEDFVYDISRDFKEAKSFFDRLCRNEASALHLREMAEDFLVEIS